MLVEFQLKMGDKIYIQMYYNILVEIFHYFFILFSNISFNITSVRNLRKNYDVHAMIQCLLEIKYSEENVYP